MSRLIAVAIALLVLLPASAQGATISSTGGEIRYVDTVGQFNAVGVTVKDGNVEFADYGFLATAGAGCSKPTGGNDRVTQCPVAGVTRIVIDLAGDDDSASIDIPVAAPPVVAMGGRGRDGISYDGAPMGVAVNVTIDGVANDGPPGRGDNVMPDVEFVKGTEESGDSLTAGERPATLYGDAGVDTLTGGPADDFIDGYDFVDCPREQEEACFEPARDTIACGGGDDVVDVDGSDAVAGDCEIVAVEDRVDLTSGDDIFRAFRSQLHLFGGRGDDRLTSFYSNRLDGGRGADMLIGGPGSDRLTGGPGRDRITGGRGRDNVLARDGERDVVRCGGDRDKVEVDRRDRVAKDCEKIRLRR